MLAGSIDEVDRTRVRGWVRDPQFPDAAVSLTVVGDGALLQRVVANQYRPDLERVGIGHGRFGFDLAFNPPLSPAQSWLLQLRSDADGEQVPGSPVRLQASGEFDRPAQDAFAAALASSDDVAELERRIAYLAAQRDALRRTWTRLQAGGPAPRPGQSAIARQGLVIDECVPEADRDGGATALLSHMRSLQRLGYELTFAAPPMTAGPGTTALEAMGVTCCVAPWFGSVEEVLRSNLDRYDLVYVHRMRAASAYTALIRQTQRRARLVYSVADLHHLRLQRQAMHEDRPELQAEAQQARATELWLADAADAVITHSSAEAAVLRQSAGGERVHVIAWSMPQRPRTVPFARRAGLALIGNYSHAPNAAAARHLRDVIMPLVRSADASITCRLIGRDLPDYLRAPQPGIEVSGWVADLDAVFNGVRLTVAPLAFGAGLKSKVLDSFAAGLPCLCSPTAAEGLDLPARLLGLVVDGPQATAQAILRLHNDEAYNTRLSARCAAFAARAFSETTLDTAMRRAVGLRETAGAGVG